MDIELVVLLLILTSVISIVLTRKSYRGKLAGRLRIDRSDPDENPMLFAEIFKGTGDISKMKYVTFEVCNESYLPQE